MPRRDRPARKARATGWAPPRPVPGRTPARDRRCPPIPAGRAGTPSEDACRRHASFCGPSPAMTSRTGRPSMRAACAAAAMRTCPPLSGVIRPAKSTVSGSPPAATQSLLSVEKSGSTLMSIVGDAVARPSHHACDGSRPPPPHIAKRDHAARSPTDSPESSRQRTAAHNGAGSRAPGTAVRTSADRSGAKETRASSARSRTCRNTRAAS